MLRRSKEEARLVERWLLVQGRKVPLLSQGSAVIAVRNPQTIPTVGQNFFEYVLEFIRDVSKTQIGEEYGPWVPFIGTMFPPSSKPVTRETKTDICFIWYQIRAVSK
ncbi:hypothetical protein PVK06_016980 [Gossypium arboreum]|uniref:Uncharacterized protein n=1 Tax=Gossypium arboreum TaxID=29729 RepID=A0ABR0Q282_GOSAR|nr:hypothetical protein PVK06_016980 [Gossypium arboreum]